jgi:hypothetical protein
MATQRLDAAADRELSELVACTLNETNLKTQRERWINLGENFGIGRHETADGLRLTFRDHPAVAAELEALVQVENDCCSWATWAVERSDHGALAMAARSQGEGITTLHGCSPAKQRRGRTAARTASRLTTFGAAAVSTNARSRPHA